MKILLIEDDVFFSKFYATKLKESNYEVTVAYDGEEGLLRIQEEKPDIILLDLIMPKMDGFAVLEALSKDNQLKKIPVLVFSTLSQDPDVERAKQLGARDYINKSVLDFQILIDKIHSIMQS